MAPFEIGLVLLGLVIGPFLNYAIYAFAYFPRPISPWQAIPTELAPRPYWRKLPILGWLGSGAECFHFGRVFWLRPLLIEIGTPCALLILYRYAMASTFMPVGSVPVGTATLMVHFVAYGLLIGLMVIATFIDFDERTIPDWVTIPGTILGLVGGVLVPDWRLHEVSIPIFPAIVGQSMPLQANSPQNWNVAWNAIEGLQIGLICWTAWCFGMMDRRWISRRGWKKAFVYFAAVLRRSPSTRPLALMWLVGMVLLCLAFTILGVERWEALLSSLLGIGMGGLLVWGFRIVSGWAMNQEALGFGDVTLMAMIGSFFGWQIVWLAFFLAPFFGLIFVIIAWIVTRDSATPFGPYLCAATLYAMLDWVALWSWWSQWFQPVQWLLPFLLGLLIGLAAILWLTQSAKQFLLGQAR